MTPCPKCGGKTWDGPRYDAKHGVDPFALFDVGRVRDDLVVWVQSDEINAIDVVQAAIEALNKVLNSTKDWLSYTCTDCRFVRYEAPLDRQPPAPAMQTSAGRSEMGPEWPEWTRDR